MWLQHVHLFQNVTTASISKNTIHSSGGTHESPHPPNIDFIQLLTTDLGVHPVTDAAGGSNRNIRPVFTDLLVATETQIVASDATVSLDSACLDQTRSKIG